MSAYGKFFVGLGLATTLGYSGLGAAVAHANGVSAAAAKPFTMVKGTDQAAVIAKFRSKMADYVEGGKGARVGKDADTPEMRIVPSVGGLIKTKLAATEIDEHMIGGPGAEFNFHGPAQATKFKVLIPVSGHYGLPYKRFAAENKYFVTVQDASGKEILRQHIKSVAFGKAESSIGREDLITEHEVTLPFDAGNKQFKVSFWPDDPSSSKGGYTAGREVIVRHVGE